MSRTRNRKSNATRKVTGRQVHVATGGSAKRGRLGNPWYTSGAKNGPIKTSVDPTIVRN